MGALLVIFGWAFTVFCLLAIVIPYRRGRSDLITSWNLFLLGSANFVGFAAVQSGQNPKPYGNYPPVAFVHFIAGAILFYIVIFFAYHRIQFPRRWAARAFRTWPPVDFGPFMFLLVCCLGLAMVGLFAPNIQFVGQILILAGRAGALLAFAFAFLIWLRQPVNPILTVSLMVVSVAALFLSIVGHSGRREMLGLVMVVPICWYWTSLRFQPPGKVLTWTVFLGIGVGLILGAYTSVRHRYSTSEARSPIQYAFESIQQLPRAILGMEGTDRLLGGDSVESSLLTIDTYYLRGNIHPFHTVIYVVVNPIPRAFWPGKPEGLGSTLPADAKLYLRMGGTYNLGAGIVGHGFHEGGYYMLVFYALLMGVAFRFADDLMANQPGNPFLAAILAASSGQILALSRGELGLFILMIIAVVATGLFLIWVARFLFGSVVGGPSSFQVPSLEEAYANAAHEYEYGSQHIDHYGN